jgi:16S rRNA (guanine(527)-N(7))-methyltransferase RsmG
LIVESITGLKSLIKQFGLSVDSQRADQLFKYLALLIKWNARINLTAATDWAALEPLFREGIWASKIYPVQALFHLDIGTGAGFPAIVLKILNPGIRLEMIESRTRKGAFLETVVHTLGLNESYVHINRLDAFLKNTESNQSWDCITWKGLKLCSSDLAELQRHAHSSTQFWMFHGKEQAVENPNTMERFFTRLRSETLSTMKEWHLSVFLIRE